MSGKPAPNVVAFRPALYDAKGFSAETIYGRFLASGTLCGHIDLATPGGTYTLSPDEATAVIAMLQGARSDVLENSDPLSDPRLFDRA